MSGRKWRGRRDARKGEGSMDWPVSYRFMSGQPTPRSKRYPNTASRYRGGVSFLTERMKWRSDSARGKGRLPGRAAQRRRIPVKRSPAASPK